MQVTVHVPPSHRVARGVAGQPDPSQQAAPPELHRAAGELGVRLTPMHPGSPDPQLRLYYTVDVPDEETARRVIERFRKANASAYLKPAEEPP
jgi:hypothetical protein